MNNADFENQTSTTEERDMKPSTERLLTDLKAVAADSQELLKEFAGDLSEKGKQARARLMATLDSAKETCADLQEKAKAGAEKADTAIREHPYSALGIAFAVGLLIGVLVGRKSHD